MSCLTTAELSKQVPNPLPFWLKGPTLVQGGRFLNCPAPRALKVFVLFCVLSSFKKMANGCPDSQKKQVLSTEYLLVTHCPKLSLSKVYKCFRISASGTFGVLTSQSPSYSGCPIRRRVLPCPRDGSHEHRDGVHGGQLDACPADRQCPACSQCPVARERGEAEHCPRCREHAA